MYHTKVGYRIFTDMRMEPETIPPRFWGSPHEIFFHFDLEQKKLIVSWHNETIDADTIKPQDHRESLDLRDYYIRLDVDWEYVGLPNQVAKCYSIRIYDGEPQFTETLCWHYDLDKYSLSITLTVSGIVSKSLFFRSTSSFFSISSVIARVYLFIMTFITIWQNPASKYSLSEFYTSLNIEVKVAVNQYI